MDDAPITASRMVSLFQRLGDDDMFSSDLTDAELQHILSPVGAAPCLILQSGSDEYVPGHVQVAALAARLAAAAGPRARVVVVSGAGHSLAGHEDEAARIISEFVGQLSGS
jgi:alpha-beta hydrolase superfamily lysophospholipase